MRGVRDGRRRRWRPASPGSSLLFRLRFSELPRRCAGGAAVWIPLLPGEDALWLRGGDGTPADVRGPVCFLQ